MNVTLKSSRIKDKKETTESESCGNNLPTQSSAIGVVTYNGLVTGNPNQAAKIILLSLLARYD